MNATVSFKAPKKSEPAIYCWWNCPQVRFKNSISKKNVTNSYADMPLKGYCPVKKYCQVKKGHIFNFTDVDKMCLPILISFLLRNLMVFCLFVVVFYLFLRTTPKSYKKIVFEKVTS